MSTEIFLFVTPSLRRVDIYGSKRPNKGPFLAALRQKAPLLEEISSEAFSSASLTTLKAFGSLKVVDVGDRIISGISDLKLVLSYNYLTALCVCLPDFTVTQICGSLALPLLRTLILEVPPASIRGVLEMLHPTPLSILKIMYASEGQETWESRWRGRLTMVAKWADSLEVLVLEDKIQEDSNDILDPSIFDSLLGITRLTRFKFESMPIVRSTDAYYSKIARAWSNIRSLDIRFTTGGYREPFAIIASLEAFATHCPNLESLSLRLSLQPSKLEPAPRCVLSHGLQQLFVEYPISGDAALIARHLLALFPYLKAVNGKDGEFANNEDLEEEEWGEWEDIQCMVLLCQATWEDQRLRQGKHRSGSSVYGLDPTLPLPSESDNVWNTLK